MLRSGLMALSPFARAGTARQAGSRAASPGLFRSAGRLTREGCAGAPIRTHSEKRTGLTASTVREDRHRAEAAQEVLALPNTWPHGSPVEGLQTFSEPDILALLPALQLDIVRI